VTGMLGIAPVTGAGQKAEGRTGPPKKGVAGERISAAGEPNPKYVCVSVIRKSTKRFCQSNFTNLTSCQRGRRIYVRIQIRMRLSRVAKGVHLTGAKVNRKLIRPDLPDLFVPTHNRNYSSWNFH